jgi:Uncharacterised MFS-type transporter YbfB
VFYGLGAIVGPLLRGHLADRAGFGPALRLSFLIEAVPVLLPVVSTAPVSLIVSSVVIGGFTPGIVPLVLGRIHELPPHSAEQQRHPGICYHQLRPVPGRGGHGFSWLFARNNGDYLLLFELGGAAVTLALAIDLVMALTVARKPPETRDDTGVRNH